MAVALFAVAFVYRFGNSSKFVNDHFMHVVWGRQWIMGRAPVRDTVTLGMPLQAAVSGWAEQLLGYRLLSEAIVVSTAFALGALLTFVLARRLSGRTWIAVYVTALQIAITPPTYSYPKIVAYAAGILMLWRYIERPSPWRASHLGLTAAVAFYFRHDHGLYLGLVAGAILVLRHWRDWRTAAARIAVLSAVCVVSVGPYVIYVHDNGGIRPWVLTLREFARREFQANPYVWPAWPLPSFSSVARWASKEDDGAVIKVRWNPGATDDMRRAAAVRYGLRVPSAGSLESGTFVLQDLTRENVVTLLRDPAIEDTAGIDRATGDVGPPGLWVGRVRLLPALDSPAASGALIFFICLGIVAVTLVVLVRPQQLSQLEPAQRLRVAAALLLTVAGVGALVREPLAARVGDALVGPLILGSWLITRWIGGSRTPWRRVSNGVAAAAVLLVMARSVFVVGGISTRLERLVDPLLWTRLTTSPPFDAWQAAGSPQYRVVRYVRTCTAPEEPLLVLWFAPELYYYADRPFAGRLGFYIKGYFTLEEEQRRNIESLERDRPTLVIIEAGREEIDLPSHPRVLAYLRASYDVVGEMPQTDGTVLRVYARRDREAQSLDPDVGWPCYRPHPGGASSG
ncbi:MAG: hypothetical protein ACRD3G_07035 [Vicinamibacterales bacterium]